MRREIRAAGESCRAGVWIRPSKLPAVRGEIRSAQARSAEWLLSTAGKAACERMLVPPPRCDQSGNIGGLQALAGRIGPEGQRDSCRHAHGNPPGAPRAAPIVGQGRLGPAGLKLLAAPPA